MQQRFIAVFAVLTMTACVPHRGEQMPVAMGLPTLGYLHVVAAIPPYNPDSATHDSNSGGLHALVGTVVDEDSGQPLAASEVIIRRASDGKIISIMTDMRGGFVVPRLPPGQYGLIVRRVGYEPLADIRAGQPGVVDTVRLKLSEARVFLRGPKWRVTSNNY